MKYCGLTLAACAFFAVAVCGQSWSQQANGVLGQNGPPVNANANAQQPIQGQYGQLPTGNQTVGQASNQPNGQVNAYNNQANSNQINNRAIGNPWLNAPGVQQQMQLTPQQSELLNRAYSSAMQKYQEGLGRLSPDLTDVQRQQRMQALQARFQQTYSRVLDSTLANTGSRQRYDQLNRQYQGFGAFNDQQLQQQMNLSPQQQQQLSRMEGEYRQQLQQLQQRGNTPQVRQEFAQLQQQARQQLGSVLNQQQQQGWAQMTGESFDFPMNSFNGNAFENGQANSNGNAGQQPNVGTNQSPGGPWNRNLPTGGGAVPLGNGASGNSGIGAGGGGTGVPGGGTATPQGGGAAVGGGGAAGGGGNGAGGGGGGAGASSN